eukprot:SAG31_NODE_4069_length_3619_cov_17.893466_2_plen_50_part_00
MIFLLDCAIVTGVSRTGWAAAGVLTAGSATLSLNGGGRDLFGGRDDQTK